MQMNEIRPGIFHITMKTRYLLTMSFMRLQEFYESPLPGIKGGYFSIEKYMDLYAERYGNFTYPTDWSGFNIPGHVVVDFYQKYRRLTNSMTLNYKEHDLMKLLEPLIKSKKKFYVIGTYEDGKRTMNVDSTIKHEVAHGHFYLNDEYKKKMSKIVFGFEFVRAFGKSLRDNGYDKSVIVDEIQAYLSTSSIGYLRKRFDVCKDPKFFVPKEFKATFSAFEKSLK